ncbi:hypothetical protein B0S90_0488 [Caldicellulosiruptor bescii]|uniref:Uncharacterized protein n=2 Tax=Caldicellulosiruptor bescii TaxID=31899 RepID=B9MMD8_CALBD|nr:hypothetical protein [Caldicellulosiruptor bescii]ACM59370.1 conserved hypothetical protein [Caldicellulosiruptor bescii DSM 6725]PBC88173.1 hypothetical protein B0S87_1137 [Caldicellulosiruptor bescii]PBC92346.1 hypothetical protein B0S89_2856 [Caldicellulosiruptor bescii]PBD04843.1 hypothetical protein B0S85_2552 [Caldicellulosiruptor bescii]PBD05527.1 hypothetical protein B0S90_0488 [Caldicellulosiruptor bescii]
MNCYLVENNIEKLRNYIEKIGPDRYAKEYLLKKMVYLHIYIEDLTPTQANIIKQTMLSIGTDAVVNKGSIDHSVQKSDCLVFGNLLQLKMLCEKLKKQPFKLKELAEKIQKIVEGFERDCLYSSRAEQEKDDT